jgi:hypothetical protein
MIKNAQFIAGFVVLSLALAGCAANGSIGSPAANAAAQNDAAVQTPNIAMTNVAGQYSGVVHDSTLQKGSATITLTQSGMAAGGTFNAIYSSSKSVQSVVALSLSGRANLRGTSVGTVVSATCTFNEQAVYHPATYRLTGSYTAIHGCSGETGTFAVKEECYYVIPTATDVVKPEIVGLHPC